MDLGEYLADSDALQALWGEDYYTPLEPNESWNTASYSAPHAQLFEELKCDDELDMDFEAPDVMEDLVFDAEDLPQPQPGKVPAAGREGGRLAPSAVQSAPVTTSGAQRVALAGSGRPTRQMVQGIELVPTRVLPDRIRSIFPFPVFNAMQSKCFPAAYQSDKNFVLSSPTGSGKTVILELAICRAIRCFPDGEFKIVYQAPTKALCAERYRDWSQKFALFNLRCSEVTGDSTMSELQGVQNAAIIITTPEKWDNMTRKWRDHEKLMRMVKLFLIDEVHILKEDRGAILEAVVSRMNTVSTEVRMLALSATIPNPQDIAAWLGQDSSNRYLPASMECFGDSFRPVKLQQHVVGFYSQGNDFAFDKKLDNKLPEVIAKYSLRKPIMIFCATRKATVHTAKLLAEWYVGQTPHARYWTPPSRSVLTTDEDLQRCVVSGVAFHHGGLNARDRQAVEKGYLEGDIQVICCTSTLAVGVNLPCHLVILKNTTSYEQRQGREYSTLEVMQMLGRAGRPQFDDTAVAVIMTRQDKVKHYENIVLGQQPLESCLHMNLIEHLNAEIGLGTVMDASSAKKWLMGTFMFVRMKINPGYYQLEGQLRDATLDDQLDHICNKDINLLRNSGLALGEDKLTSTELGEAMARYYINYATMKVFLGLPEKAKLSDILAAVTQATEFCNIRFRSGEKPEYKRLNSHSSIRFPIPVNLDASYHKASLIIQAVLGGIEFRPGKNRAQYDLEVSLIFQHVDRLIRCIIDCQLHRRDATGARNALMMARSLNARTWDDSPLQMKQLHGIGNALVRRLVNHGIKSLDELQHQEPHRIETILNRRPGAGLQLLDQVKALPRLRISLSIRGLPQVTPDAVCIKLSAAIGFMNDKIPLSWQRRPVYVCLLAETSDGRMIHFRRISAQMIDSGQEVQFNAPLTSATQHVACYVMCDGIAGTQRVAILDPRIQASLFPTARRLADDTLFTQSNRKHRDDATFAGAVPNRSSAAADSGLRGVQGERRKADHDYTDDDLEDSDLMRAITNAADPWGDDDEIQHDLSVGKPRLPRTHERDPRKLHWKPTRLENGNWQCKHACKDKARCKHRCCQEGLEKKPKPPKMSTQEREAQATATGYKPNTERQPTKSLLTNFMRKPLPPESHESSVQLIDLCSPAAKCRPADGSWKDETEERTEQGTPQLQSETELKNMIQQDPTRGGSYPELASGLELCDSERDEHGIAMRDFCTGNRNIDGFAEETQTAGASGTEPYGEDDSTIDEALTGLADSFELANGHSPTPAPSQEVEAPRSRQPPSKRLKTQHAAADASPVRWAEEHVFSCDNVARDSAQSDRPADGSCKDGTEQSAAILGPCHDTADVDRATIAREWLIDMGWADCIEIIDTPERA